MTKFCFDNGKNLFETYDKTENDALLNQKANAANVYNKTTVDDKISIIGVEEIGKNIINPETRVDGFLLNTGVIDHGGAYDNYKTSDFADVEPSTNYVFTAFYNNSAVQDRKLVLYYDENKNPITTSYQNVSGELLVASTSPENAAFVRVCSIKTLDFQFEKGTTSTNYEPYSKAVVLNETAGLTGTMQNEVKSLISHGKLSVNMTLPYITILSDFGTKKLKRYLEYRSNDNRNFNFNKATIIDGETETRIKDCSDDITPLRIGCSGSGSAWTIGANHGWFAIRIPRGELTTDDIGSIWTDGTNNYILAAVSTALAYFIPPVTYQNNKYNFYYTLPESDLMHVSGATHTSNVDITDAVQNQLYPSVNKRSVKYYADGVEKTDGAFACDHFTVKEEYSIIDFADLAAYLPEHIGEEINDNISNCVKIQNVYDFVGNACIITTSVQALKAVELTNCGLIQAGVIDVAGTDKRYFYVNNQDSNSDIESAVLYDATSNTAQITIYSTNAIDSDVATNRFVELLKTNGGVNKYGFACGFIPDISSGKDSARKTLERQGEFRSGYLKCYPVGIWNESFNSGDFKTYVCYRNYFNDLGVTNCSIISANNATYVVVDIHQTITNANIELTNDLIGKEIEIVESYNFNLKSDVVGNAGVVFDISNNYGCAILKIK